jgi:RNA polymerase sigma-70 factor (ECF subfamily)
MTNDAFERAVSEHKDRVHAYAALMLRDTVEAQDVAQEALIRLWRHRGRVDTGGARPWLMRTTHNLCIDRIRKRKVRSEADDGVERIDRQSDDHPGPGQLAESSELGRAIQRALAALGPEDRAVIVMREVQGMPYDEIAGTLGVPLGTLKARLHRARDRLRGKLARVGVTP